MRVATLLLFLCGLAGCGPQSGPPTVEDAAAPDVAIDVEALSSSIPRWMERAGIPGLSIAVIESGELVWAEGFGVSDVRTGELVTRDTVFQAASLSKPVFSLVYLQLLEERGLDLDRALSERIEYERFEETEYHARLTARHVLSHRTGLPNWDREGALDFDRAPGERYGYSGEGFVYLQRYVEALAGEPLEALARERIFHPLGMERSAFAFDPSFEGVYAAGHDEEGEPRDGRKFSEANAAYSLLTTAPDYATFLVALMDGGGLGLSPATHESIFETQTTMTGEETKSPHSAEVWSRIGWGLSWGIFETESGPLYWHWGDNGTYRAFVAFDRASKRGFVYFTNSESGLAIADAIAERVVGDMSAVLEWLEYDVLEPSA